MPLYALRITLTHRTFRIPSLLSIAQLYGFHIRFVSENVYRSVLVVELEKEEDVKRILERGTLVHSAVELFASAKTYDELHAALQQQPQLFEKDMDKSFKFTLESINHKVKPSRQKETINAFRWTGLRGKVDMLNPEVEYVILEDYDVEESAKTHLQATKLARDGRFDRVYFGRRIGFSTARPLINAHSVKTRAYYGNTSMDAEMGFLLAGQALPAPGKIVYDPFVGTGSLLFAVAHWGAYVIGSDIDGRQIRGKSKGKGVTPGMLLAAEQYGVADRFLDNLAFDVTRSPWRRGGWVDAIVTDPPYGVRAGAKRLGKREGKKPAREEPYLLPNGEFSHEQPDYLPPMRPYELSALTLDLVRHARYFLVPRGRLVFFLPTVTEEYDAIDVPVVEGMRELKHGEGSVQEFGKWGRRLITMEKTAEDDGPPPDFADPEDVRNGNIPAHHHFRERYFEGFVPRGSVAGRDGGTACVRSGPAAADGAVDGEVGEKARAAGSD